MTLKIVDNWWAVLTRAWSLRLIEAAAVADIVLNVVPSMADLLPWWLTLVVLALAWIARLLPQFKISGEKQ